MKKVLAWAILILVLVLIGFLLNEIYRLGFDVKISAPANIEVSYSDFIVILLTSVTVVISLLGLAIAVLAVVGWQTLGKKVEEKSQEILGAAVDEGGALHDTVKREVREIMYKDILPINIEGDDPEEDENKGTDS